MKPDYAIGTPLNAASKQRITVPKLPLSVTSWEFVASSSFKCNFIGSAGLTRHVGDISQMRKLGLPPGLLTQEGWSGEINLGPILKRFQNGKKNCVLRVELLAKIPTRLFF